MPRLMTDQQKIRVVDNEKDDYNNDDILDKVQVRVGSLQILEEEIDEKEEGSSIESVFA